jgi:hypothetical protein
MDRYKNGKIYKIVCNVTGKVYIGSTCKKTLAHRLAQHRADYKRFLDKKTEKYMTSFKVLENNNYSIILMEEYPCETKEQLLAQERYYIENNECVNKYIPNRTIKEYYEANKEQILEQQKEYYETNKEQISEYQKEYYEANKEQISEYQKEYQKEYYKINKEHILKRQGESHKCECGGNYAQNHKLRHFKTQKHLNYLDNIKNSMIN